MPSIANAKAVAASLSEQDGVETVLPMLEIGGFVRRNKYNKDEKESGRTQY